MKLDVLGLQAFVAVAREGGFGSAARRLHLTQTALTRRLQGLEAALGTRLFDRTTRSVALTPVGRDFLPRAQRLVDDLGEALVSLRDTVRHGRGEVTIACVPTVAFQLLPGIVARYAHDHPDNRIRILDLSTDDVIAAVRQGRAEFGLAVDVGAHAGLTARKLFRDPFVYVCRDDHRLAARRSLRWADLSGEPLIAIGRLSGNRMLLDVGMARAGASPSWRYEVQHVSTALGLVAAGVGTAVLPRLTLRSGAWPGIRIVRLVAPALVRAITLVRREGASLSPAGEALHALVAAEADGRDRERGAVAQGQIEWRDEA